MGVVEYEGKEYDDRHGGPWDRGAADSYYRRGFNPHFFYGATYQSPRLEESDMSQLELEAYQAGYDYNEELGYYKEW